MEITSKDLQRKAFRRDVLKPDARVAVVIVRPGLSLVYRKGRNGSGTWTARLFREGTSYDYERLGRSDDDAPADGGTFLSFAQADALAREWMKRKAAEASGEVIGGSYTVQECMADYITHSARERKIKPDDPKLARVQAVIDAFILPALGKLEAVKVTHTRLKAWRDALADSAPRVRTKAGKEQAHRKLDGNDPDAVRRRQATVNRVLTTLKAALNHAKAQKRIASDAAWVDVKPFKRVDVPKIRFLTVPEVSAVVPACEEDFGKLVKGALLTGCRYGELTAMLVGEFSEQDERVYVARSKNGEARYVDLNPAGVQFLASLVKDRKPTEKLFLRANGSPWQQSEQKRPMDAACNVAGVEGVTFHILRHTYASHAVMDGMTIEVLATQLGHKDTRITSRHYAHLCPTFKAESVKRHAPSFGF